MEILRILKEAVDAGAADVLLIGGLPVTFKIEDEIVRQGEERLSPADTEKLVLGIYELAGGRNRKSLDEQGDDDFSFSVPGLSRFRVNAFFQRGSLAAVIRVVHFSLPDRTAIGIPDAVMAFANKHKGLVLVTGPAGSGKSTTLACLIDQINRTRPVHIITIEDPIEFLHRHAKGVVTQRELSTDTQSYDRALRAALRQSPDVILLGEMRDYETIRAAITAAETGHLIISTVHTLGASNTIDRVIDAFPPTQQQQIRVQLAATLQGIVSQQLIPGIRGGLVPAFEVLTVNGAVRNMIRESKLHQLEGVIQAGAKEGMITMDAYLAALVQEGKITAAAAVDASENPERLAKRLGVPAAE